MEASRFSIREPEARRLCPVCPGLPMRKLEVGRGPSKLLLDCCGRCGGMWFDAGEPDRLRQLGVKAIEAEVTLSPTAYRKRCGKCEASYERNEDRCPVCRAPNDLRCPSCSRLMKPVRSGGAKVDACSHCRGVWFDNVELKELWNAALARHRRAPVAGEGVHAASMVMDSFFLASLLAPGPGSSTGVGQHLETAAGVGGDGLASGGTEAVAEAGGSLLEGTADAAGSLFEAIADLIGGMFS